MSRRVAPDLPNAPSASSGGLGPPELQGSQETPQGESFKKLSNVIAFRIFFLLIFARAFFLDISNELASVLPELAAQLPVRMKAAEVNETCFFPLRSRCGRPW